MPRDELSGDTVAYFQALGPWTTADVAAAYLHMTVEDLRQMVHRNEVIGVRFADGQLYLPTWQLRDGEVLDGVEEVLKVLMPALRAPETCAAWFLSTVYEEGLLRHIDELRAGRVAPVVRHADIDARRLLGH